ncbi:hypothetical protein ACCO45_002670 [Purpureocillium lilacinum]|uniref:Uncharacterized protein n=1 Tax=Purpureocillium lilacinum TaxID=33203 RepID=A0ACC4ECC0_PURLI
MVHGHTLTAVRFAPVNPPSGEPNLASLCGAVAPFPNAGASVAAQRGNRQWLIAAHTQRPQLRSAGANDGSCLLGAVAVAWQGRRQGAEQDPSDAPTSNHGDGLDSGGRVQADVEWDDGFQAAHEMEAPAPTGSGCRDKRGSVVWIGILRWLGMDPRPLKMVPLNNCAQRQFGSPRYSLVRAQNHGHPEPPCLASAPFRHGAGGRAAAAAALADSSHEVRTGLNVIDQLWSPHRRLLAGPPIRAPAELNLRHLEHPNLKRWAFHCHQGEKTPGQTLPAKRNLQLDRPPVDSAARLPSRVPAQPLLETLRYLPVRYDPVASAETARPDAHP